MAGRVTIAEVDELVAVGALDPDEVHLPGIFVQRVVHVPEHATSSSSARRAPGRHKQGA
jgi:acyl CoA:acetate/3-ketoacid CoA transferase alpha subunit